MKSIAICRNLFSYIPKANDSNRFFRKLCSFVLQFSFIPVRLQERIEVCDVFIPAENEGHHMLGNRIRIHTGTKPEHSTGCVLVSAFGKQQIIDFINQKAKQNEKVYLTIAADL